MGDRQRDQTANYVFLEGICLSDPEEVSTTWGTALRCLLQVQGFYGPAEVTVMVRNTQDPEVNGLKKGVRVFVRGFIGEEDGEVWIEVRGIFITGPAGL
ncbi:MAG: hypothetical protein ACPLQP_07945 [Moorellaceae bacterium]